LVVCVAGERSHFILHISNLADGYTLASFEALRDVVDLGDERWIQDHAAEIRKMGDAKFYKGLASALSYDASGELEVSFDSTHLLDVRLLAA
jgi:hypothetical protein